MSFATVTPTNMELSPMRVSFKAQATGSFVDVGGTLGNVTVSAAYKKSPIKADQFGSTVLDNRVSGVEIKVTTEFAEIQNKALWSVLFPHSTTIAGSGGFAGQSVVDFLSAIGGGDLSVAGQLLLHPLSKADSDKNTDYTFFKAVATEESEVVYGPEGQSKLKIVWMILPDTSVQPAKFMRYGDALLT